VFPKLAEHSTGMTAANDNREPSQVKRAVAALMPPVFALLLGIFPVVTLFSQNLARLSFSHMLYTAAASLAIMTAMTWLLRYVMRERQTADLLATSTFAAVFLPVVYVGSDGNWLYWLAGWAAFAVAIAVSASARRIATSVATVTLAIFIAQPVYAILTSPILGARGAVEAVTTKAFGPTPQADVVIEKPDVYYFVFDRYARADMLKSVYGFDNRTFLDALRQRGFVIADQSYANYQRTTHSVLSSLNFDYLDAIETPATKTSEDWQPLYAMFQDFRSAQFFKSQGYSIHFSGTWWEPTRRLGMADANHNFFEMPELARFVYENSLIVAGSRALGLRSLDPLYWQCQRSQLMFDQIGDQSRQAQPKFHFAHFLVPHPPFVKDSTGRCLTIAEAQNRSRNENYAGQVAYANGEILKMVDKLLAKPGPKPIIILQADEGPWPLPYAGDEVAALGRDVSNVDWENVPAAELQEKMAILNAVYAPGLKPGSFTNISTPVNTFRVILRDYFKVAIDPLPDRMIVYKNANDLYSFKDVTSEVIAD
jgi:hypothetical protein